MLCCMLSYPLITREAQQTNMNASSLYDAAHLDEFMLIPP